MPKISIIVPVYNRPEEIDELLESLTKQTDNDFEVLVVEDGSSVPCQDICTAYQNRLDVKYLPKQHSGQYQSRNYGAERSSGDYLLMIDSDTTLHSHYIETLKKELQQNYCSAYGAPDKASENFSDMQKAVDYAIKSFFHIGCIVDRKNTTERFCPRSFNLGISREAFFAVKGFSSVRYGGDIDLNIKLHKAGYSIRTIDSLYVYHKRRTDMEQFFNSARLAGNARINIWRKHQDYQGALKIVHFLPSIFTVSCLLFAFLGLFASKYWVPIFLFALIVLADATLRNKKNFKIGLWAVVASFAQLLGYGIGFLDQLIKYLRQKWLSSKKTSKHTTHK